MKARRCVMLNLNCYDTRTCQNVTMILFVILMFVRLEVDGDSNYYVIQMPADDPPNNKIPLNNPPMQVFWNVPTMQCTSKKVLFQNLYEKYGIIQNQGDSFRGDKISILYDPGLFPAIFKNETSGKFKFRNGGVPQEGDLQKHLEFFRSNLNQSIPDEKFDGIGIIDFESWRPIYRQNFGVLSPYKDVSYEIERNNHWWWPSNMVAAEAKRRFEESAHMFMADTLRASKEMRPLAKWGYYAYPYCFNTKSEQCADKVLSENDYLSWFWSESTALYPSVYISKELTTNQLTQLVKGRVREAERVNTAHGRKGVPILPYYWFKYRDGDFMKEEDVEAVFKTFDSSQAAGFIIWGSSNDVNTFDKCIKLLNYVENILGPAVAKYTKTQRIIHNLEANNNSVTDVNHTNTSTIEVSYINLSNFYNLNEAVNINKTVIKEDNISTVLELNEPDEVYQDLNEKVQERSEINSTDAIDKVHDATVPGETFIIFNESTTTVASLTPVPVTERKENNAGTEKRFSSYSLPDTVIINKIRDNIGFASTESVRETSTESKPFDAEFHPDYIWDPPENYTHDIVKYMKEEFVKESDTANNISNVGNKTTLEDKEKNNSLIDILLDTIFLYRNESDLNTENNTEDLTKTLLDDRPERIISQNIFNVSNNYFEIKCNQTQLTSTFVNPLCEQLQGITNVESKNRLDDGISTAKVLTALDLDKTGTAEIDVSEDTTTDSSTEALTTKSGIDIINDEMLFDNYLESDTKSTTDNNLDVNITIFTNESATGCTTEISLVTNHDNNINNHKDLNRKANNVTAGIYEDYSEHTSSTDHKLKMHHSKNRKKGRSKCHQCHHMHEEEKEETPITNSTTVEPEKNNFIKEIIDFIISKDKKKGMAKDHASGTHDNPVSEELISSDFTTDKVVVSLV